MKKVKFGIIGTSSISNWVLKGAMLDERFKLQAVYSRDYNKGKEFACEYEVQNIFTSLDEMLNVIDALYIASPNAIHYSQACKALERGIPVLCEKPICSNFMELSRLIDLSVKNNVPLMEAMISTLNPNFIKLKENINKIGVPRKYFSSYCQYSSRYNKFKEGVIENAFKLELSNGALMDIGIYTIYPMVVLFGEPISIKACGNLLSTGVDSCGSILFSFKNGLDATVIYSKIYDSDLPTQVIGEDGLLALDKINIPRELYFKTKNTQHKDISANHCGNDYYYEIKEFIDMIEDNKISHSINSHRNSLIVMNIMDEVRKQIGVIYPADRI